MITIIDFTEQNKHEFIEMCRNFYTSDAVLHPIPDQHIITTANECVAKNPFMRGVILSLDAVTVGYALLSFSYSNEAGGMELFVEEIFIQATHRGKGIAKQFFSWLFREYNSTMKRYRLEVSAENEAVCRLYRSQGFVDLDYLQMVLDAPFCSN